MEGYFSEKEFYALAGLLTKAEGYDGWVIGGCTINRCKTEGNLDTASHTSYEVKVKRPKDGYALISACIIGGNTCTSMEIRIVPAENSFDNSLKDIREFSANEEPVAHFSFTSEEITEFADRVNDSNPIHRTDNPVVPGLLLLKQIFSCGVDAELGYFSVKARFKIPVYAMQRVKLYRLSDNRGRVRYSGVFSDADGIMREAFYAVLEGKSDAGGYV